MDKASYSASVSIIAGGVAGASESFITVGISHLLLKKLF